MDLLELEGGLNVRISPHALQIKEFAAIAADYHKDIAYKLLAYIYFMEHPRSNYIVYDADLKEQNVLRDLGLTATDITNKIMMARMIYRNLIRTRSSELLASARIAVDRMNTFFNNVDFSERDHDGKPVYNPSTVMSSLTRVGTLVNSLKQLEEQVNAEMEASTIRGGAKVSKYNR